MALISGLVLFTNVLSTYAYQHMVQYHYSMVAVPALAIGAVNAAGALHGRLRTAAVTAALATSVVAAALWGPLPFSRNELAYWAPSNPVAVAAREIVDEVPDGAVVSAHHSIAPHLSRRREIYMFPNPFRVVLYDDVDIEGTRLTERAERVEYLVLPVRRSAEESADFAAIDDAFVLVEANEHWQLFRRQGDLPPP